MEPEIEYVQKIEYVWSELDVNLLAGSEGGEQQANRQKLMGKYATPYGMAPDEMKRMFGTPAAKSPVTLDLAWSLGGECWRANRFHVAGSWMEPTHVRWGDWEQKELDHPGQRDTGFGAYHRYEWIEWEIPPGVSTLGALCEHLAKLDSGQFPTEIYQNASELQQHNPSMMLFDYWGNSKWRAEMLMQPGVQAKYWRAPHEIEIAPVGGASFGWVLRRKTVLPPVPVAPNPPTGKPPAGLITKKTAPPELLPRIREYIDKLLLACSKIRSFFELSDSVLRERLTLVAQAAAIKTAAEVARDSNKYCKDPVEIVSVLDGVLPSARDYFLTAPVAGENKFISTTNARASIDGWTTTLHDLLFTETYRDLVRDWCRAMVDIYSARDSRLKVTIDGQPLDTPLDTEWITLDERLQDMLAVAVEIYAEAAYQIDGETPTGWMTHAQLTALHDAAPDEHAKDAGAVQGVSPIAVHLSAAGKGLTTGRKVAKVGVSLLLAASSWRLFKEGKAALARGPAAANDFAEAILSRLPKKIFDGAGEEVIKLQDEARAAIQGLDKDAAAKLCDKIAKKREPAAFKSLCKLFDLASALVALGSAKDGSAFVVGLTWAKDGLTVVEKGLGVAALLIEHVAGFEARAAQLVKAGAAVGVLSAAAGLAIGVLKLVDAATQEKVDVRAVAAAALQVASGLTGTAAAILVAAGAASGGTVFALEAISAAFTIIAGFVEPSKGTPSMSTNAISAMMTRLVVDLRARPYWKQLEEDCLDVWAQMSRVQGLCEGGGNGDLIAGSNTSANWSTLRRAGFADGTILALLATGGATRPNDASPDWR